MKPKATLKKIADTLQLSISTVSRALKAHPDISEETRRKVQELAELMEYEPNTHAISLRTNHSKVFAIMVPAITNFFYQSFISAVEEESRLHGYSLLILQSGDDPQTELINLKLCRQNRVAGIFVSVTIQTTDIKPFLKMDDLDVPVVFFDKVPDFEACNKVCIADALAAEMAVDALMRRKRKKILGLFGNRDMSITKKRLVAFNNRLTDFGKGVEWKTAHAQHPQEARERVHEYAASGWSFDGIFCMSDDILMGVMKAIQELKYPVPKRVSVISLSDGFLPQLYEPEISFVETSGYKLGKVTFTRMLACLSGSTFVQEIRVDPVLMERGSL
jgi:LacI family transcriptional regulator